MTTILIIDDSNFGRKMTSKAINEEGWNIHEAGSGAEGIEKIETLKPDCVLLDLFMPGMDGHEFLKKLASKDLNVPVIVITADIQNSTRTKVLELGASAVLPKPVDKDKVVEAIQRVIDENR